MITRYNPQTQEVERITPKSVFDSIAVYCDSQTGECRNHTAIEWAVFFGIVASVYFVFWGPALKKNEDKLPTSLPIED